MEVMADQKAVGLQLPELFGQGGFGDFFQLTAQLAEPVDIVERDIVENFQLPFATQYFLQGGHGFAASDHGFGFSHLGQPPDMI